MTVQTAKSVDSAPN